MPRYYSARDAAAQLGISLQTLYSYVSRGLLRAHAAQDSRERRYLADEVTQLARRRAHARKPREVAKDALSWGLPVVESSICLIQEGRLYYRGRDALELAHTHSVEQVAALLWEVPVEAAFPAQAAPLPAQLISIITRQCPGGAHTRLLPRFAAVQNNQERASPGYGELTRTLGACLLRRAPDIAPLHRQFASGWGLSARQAEWIRAALILCADHELNASSFTVRCITSTEASIHSAILGGLAALSGGLHGGATSRVEELWNEIAAARRPELVLQTKLQRGDSLPGFGHPLYPQGDARAAAILAAISGKRARWRGVTDAVEALTGLRPSLDFALVALRRHLGLPEGSAFGIFAVGRSVGWIAHALEQRQRGQLIRPRAAYVGPPP